MKPRIAKGTRDFLPKEVFKRQYIFRTIEKIYIKYGFEPIETPTMELLETLTGKYGEEGDRLLFKILNNGDFLAKADQKHLEDKNSQGLVSSISKRGLRYDLTVPFARFVVMHQNDIQFPFKRYQIQPVWRADRPQKGRYQEFYQCDADVVGSSSLMYEAELVQIMDEVFSELSLPALIKVNHRKILFGLAEVAGIKDSFMDMCISLDKLDKVGEEGVRSDLANKSVSNDAIDSIFKCLKAKELNELERLFLNSETGLEGIADLKKMYEFLNDQNLNNEFQWDISLARGLNYYTGCIFEVLSKEVKIGSIAGGGRYDELTSVFGLNGVSGVGISFGADRIYDVLTEKSLFPEDIGRTLKLMILSFDEESHKYAYGVAARLRSEDVSVDIYPEPAKMAKQMKYANSKNVPFVLIIGEEERNSGLFSLKDMENGEQEKLNMDQILLKFS